MKKAVVLINLMILLLGSLFVQAQQVVATNANAVPPPLINFSGVLTDANGKPVTSTVVATFCLYSEQTGGAALWVESQNVQPDATGHYTVMLGSTSSAGLPSEMFIAGQAHWLGVQVQGEQEQPRVLLVSAPYALKAGDAQTLGGLPASAFVLAAPTSGAAMSDAAPASTSAAPTASVSSDTTSDVTTSGGTVDALPLFSSATNIQNSIVTQTGTTAVNVAGRLNLPASGTATSSAGFTSRPLDFVASSYDSGTAAAVAETFQWQANAVGNDTASPSATLNLLFGSGTSAPAQTGLNIASNGLITFAKGQTFPGTGKGTITGVTAGTDLTGGGTSGSVTLNLNTSALNSTYAQLGAANAFTGNQTITGDLTVEYSGSGTGLYLNAPGAYYGFQAIGDAIGALGNAVATGGDGVYGNSTGGHGVYGIDLAASGASVGVYGQSNSSAGTGVVGSSANVGVDGQASGTSAGAAGVYGVAGGSSSNETYGVIGNNTGSNWGEGVYGQDSTTGTRSNSGVAFKASLGGLFEAPAGIGVWGDGGTSGNWGIVGTTDGVTAAYFGSPAQGVQGEGPCCSNITIYGMPYIGVWGDTGGPAGESTGVMGTAGDAYAGYFLNDSNTDTTLYLENDGTDGTGASVIATHTASGNCSIGAAGDVACTGKVASVVATEGGTRKVSLYALQSPENWFEDFGSGALVNGSATVALDPAFASTVNTNTDYHVFLTPRGECEGLYIANATPTGFEVRELRHGTSSVAFDYRIVAKRSGYEKDRLQDVTAQFEAITAQSARLHQPRPNGNFMGHRAHPGAVPGQASPSAGPAATNVVQTPVIPAPNVPSLVPPQR